MTKWRTLLSRLLWVQSLLCCGFKSRKDQHYKMYSNVVLFWLVSYTDLHFTLYIVYIVNLSFSHLTLSTVACQTCIWVAHSVKLLRLNVAGSVFESRWSMNGLQQVLWSEAARTFLLFQMSDLPCALYLNQKRVFAPSHLNFCSVLNYYTSELICFFHIHSVSAVLLLPLCATPYGSFTGLAPGIAACSYIGSYSC